MEGLPEEIHLQRVMDLVILILGVQVLQRRKITDLVILTHMAQAQVILDSAPI
jgi:hypothetical protein